MRQNLTHVRVAEISPLHINFKKIQTLCLALTIFKDQSQIPFGRNDEGGGSAIINIYSQTQKISKTSSASVPTICLFKELSNRRKASGTRLVKCHKAGV